MQINTTLPGNAGFRIDEQDAPMTIAAGVTVTKGKVYQVDNTTATEAAHGVLSEVKAVVAADSIIPQTLYVVALEDGAAGETKMFRFSGWVEARMDAGFTPAANSKLGAAFGDTMAAASIEGAKCIAFNPELAPAAGALIYVYFKGDGFGTFALFGTA